jgi:hypothetical protein
MILDDLTKGLRNRLDEVFAIKNSLSILNIPKQELFDKGEIVVLLGANNKPVIVEFLKVGKYHVELKNTQFPKMLVEDILASNKAQLFETTDYDPDYDNDLFINYSDLTADQKKSIKLFMKNAETKICVEHTKFGKLSLEGFNKTINVQNGIFTTWMNERGYNEPNKECLKEAYRVAHESNDMLLKKRASAAKCFHKIYTDRKK